MYENGLFKGSTRMHVKALCGSAQKTAPSAADLGAGAGAMHNTDGNLTNGRPCPHSWIHLGAPPKVEQQMGSPRAPSAYDMLMVGNSLSYIIPLNTLGKLDGSCIVPVP